MVAALATGIPCPDESFAVIVCNGYEGQGGDLVSVLWTSNLLNLLVAIGFSIRDYGIHDVTLSIDDGSGSPASHGSIPVSAGRFYSCFTILVSVSVMDKSSISATHSIQMVITSLSQLW